MTRPLQIHHRLLEAYGQPTWRNPLPLIDELVSTILSQNTNDINRDRAFEGLRARFPTWEAVRDAPPAADAGHKYIMNLLASALENFSTIQRT